MDERRHEAGFELSEKRRATQDNRRVFTEPAAEQLSSAFGGSVAPGKAHAVVCLSCSIFDFVHSSRTRGRSDF